jgi:hypothetical protein
MQRYAIPTLAIDGKPAGRAVVESGIMHAFRVGAVITGAGTARLTLAPTNDHWEQGNDRNLYVNAVGFLPAD